MLRDFPACAGLCQNSNIDISFVDENEFGGGDRQRINALFFSRSYNGKKVKVHLYLIVVNIKS